MNRALTKLLKMAPGLVDFDTMIIITDSKRISMLVPAISYQNVELDYQSSWENYRIKKNQKKIHEEHKSWNIQKILLVVPRDVMTANDFEDNVGKFIDGMITASVDVQKEAKGLANLSKAIEESFERKSYAMEHYLGELGNFLLQFVKKSEQKDIAAFVEAVKTSKLASLFTDKKLSFDESNTLVGNSAIFRGVKKKGFMTLQAIEEDKKKKEEEKAKGKKK